mgnify:CR=1 FL=1
MDKMPKLGDYAKTLRTTQPKSCMRTLKFSFWLSTALVILTCVLLLATHPRKKTYTISGTVDAHGIPLPSITVYITQQSDFPGHDFSKLHRAWTDENGRFSTDIFGEVNAPFYLYVKPDGMKPVREVFYPVARDGKDQQLRKSISFAPLPDELNLQRYGSENPSLPFFGHRCADEAIQQFPVEEIQFLENLQPKPCPRKLELTVQADFYTRKGRIAERYFREVLKQPAGMSDKIRD